MRSPILLSMLLLFSCEKHEEKKKPDTFEKIREKAEMYCDLSKVMYEKDGYVVSKCDGAGFTSLYSLACPKSMVDLTVFQDENTGEMFRNPDHDCYPDQSKASYSKDHVLMRLVAAQAQKDKKWAMSFISWVDKNNGTFCEAVDEVTKISRCVISPFLYVYMHKVAGKDIFQSDDEVTMELAKEDFERHLDALGIWLKGRTDGYISSKYRERLREYAALEPSNALYQALAYRYDAATKEAVLKAFEQPYWPDDRLPNSSTHCTEYLFQRDMLRDDAPNKDWLPCPEKDVVYSGTDYAFAYYVLTK